MGLLLSLQEDNMDRVGLRIYGWFYFGGHEGMPICHRQKQQHEHILNVPRDELARLPGILGAHL